MIQKTSISLLGLAAYLAAGTAYSQDASPPPVVGNIMVSGSDVAELAEDRPVGEFKQPSWVKNRRFSNTRVFVQRDAGEIGLEQWYRARTYDSGRVTQRTKTEFEIGLPYRMQMDIYENLIHDNENGRGWQQQEVSVELRYAFADWGVIPLNPTVYFEYAFAKEGADGIEPKLLIGDDFGSGWHWGVNFIHERRVWGKPEAEWGIAAGLSKSLVDSRFSVGFEGKWTHPEGGKDEGIFGPSIQWLPTDNSHVDLVAMAGINNSSPNTEIWLIYGFNFGSGKKKQQGYKPSSFDGN